MEEHRGGFDRGVLLSFLGSGALWIVGFSVWLGNAYLGAFAAVYVALGSLALATRRLPTGRTLVAAWVAAILLLVAMDVPSWSWIALPFTVVLGSFLFGLWTMAGFLLLGAFTGRSPLDPPRPHQPS